MPKQERASPDGEIGIIELKGDNVFTGYWQMPEKQLNLSVMTGFSSPVIWRALTKMAMW